MKVNVKGKGNLYGYALVLFLTMTVFLCFVSFAKANETTLISVSATSSANYVTKAPMAVATRSNEFINSTPTPEIPRYTKGKSGKFSYTIDNVLGEATITNYSGNKKKLVIPTKIAGHKVGAFDPEMIKLFKVMKFTSLHIPQTVTNIVPGNENDYLAGWVNLKKITVAKGNPVYKTVKGVLIDKKSKTLIECPNKLKIKVYKTPKGVRRIAWFGLVNDYVEKITIGKSVREIGDYSLSAPKLRELVISSKVTTLGAEMCRGCEKLNKVKMSKGIKIIPSLAFAECKSLKKISVSKKVKVAADAFPKSCKVIRK